MQMDWKKCRVIAKIDPEKPLTDALVKGVMASGVEGILIGGTQGIVRQKVEEAWDAFQGFSGQLAVEISSEECLIDPFIPYWVPMVINSPSAYWLVGAHQEAFLRYGPLVKEGDLYPVGYIVLNPQAAVAQKCGIIGTSSPREAEAWALVGQKLLGLPALYLEYSGCFGDVEVVRAIGEGFPGIHRIYGGGLTSGKQAEAMAPWVDTLVVGNLLYEPFGLGKLREIVDAIKVIDNPI